MLGAVVPLVAAVVATAALMAMSAEAATTAAHPQLALPQPNSIQARARRSY